MIFDDTTSSVDVETEQHIFDALKTYSHHKTMFLIAHRIISVMDVSCYRYVSKPHWCIFFFGLDGMVWYSIGYDDDYDCCN